MEEAEDKRRKCLCNSTLIFSKYCISFAQCVWLRFGEAHTRANAHAVVTKHAKQHCKVANTLNYKQNKIHLNNRIESSDRTMSAYTHSHSHRRVSINRNRKTVEIKIFAIRSFRNIFERKFEPHRQLAAHSEAKQSKAKRMDEKNRTKQNTMHLVIMVNCCIFCFSPNGK